MASLAGRRAGGLGPGERARAEGHIAELYRSAGYSPPGRFVWMGSPFALARDCTRHVLRGRDLTAELIEAPLEDVRGQLQQTGQVARHPSFGPAAVITEAVSATIASLELRWPVRWLSPARSAARGWNPTHGVDADVAALHIAALQNAEGTAWRRLAPLVGLAGLVGWIVPCRRCCWLSEPPTELLTDASGRLHCASGPAVEYPDGWQLHAWKGVVVPGWIIECPWRLTASVVDHPHSALVRRCMIDIMTPARFVAQGGAHCLSSDSTGKLWWRRWWNRFEDVWDAWAAVEVMNGTEEPDGTRQRYFLQVPPDMRTARQAVAWTYGLTEQQYSGLVQRT